MITFPLLALIFSMSGPSSAAAFNDAKAFYDSGRYEEAASIFSELARAAPLVAHHHYNLGNAWMKSGRLGLACGAYQRAFELDPRDPDIRHNLDFALRRAGEQLAPPDVPAPAFMAFTILSARELAGLHWLLAWTTLGLCAFCLRCRSQTRQTLRRLAAASAASWALVAIWWGSLHAILPPGRGVITARVAELRNGPGQSFSVGYTAPEGRRVRLLSRNGDWLEIGLLKEGVKGWVPSASVELLDHNS